MIIKSIVSPVGKSELAAWGILALVFFALGVFHANAWGFVAVAALFLIYVSWTNAALFVGTRDLKWGNVSALAILISIATFKVLVCLGLVWSILWGARHLFKF